MKMFRESRGFKFVAFEAYSLYSNRQCLYECCKSLTTQECISVGCVPPASYRAGGLHDRDPPGQRPPRQRPPRQRPPRRRPPGQRPQTETPWTETPTPRQKHPCTETPGMETPRDGDPPPLRNRERDPRPCEQNHRHV